MQKWEYLTLTIMYGEDETIDVVYCDDRILYLKPLWAMILQYIETLKSLGWELIKEESIEWEATYQFRRQIQELKVDNFYSAISSSYRTKVFTR